MNVGFCVDDILVWARKGRLCLFLQSISSSLHSCSFSLSWPLKEREREQTQHPSKYWSHKHRH